MGLSGRAGWAGHFLRAGLVVALLSGAAKAGDSESQRFAAFLSAVYQQNLANSPQLATEFGSKAGYDRWDDSSEPALARRVSAKGPRLSVTISAVAMGIGGSVFRPSTVR